MKAYSNKLLCATLFFFAASVLTFAQEKVMHIYRGDNIIYDINASQVDSIPLNDKTLHIYSKGNIVKSLNTTDVDSITFDKPYDTNYDSEIKINMYEIEKDSQRILRLYCTTKQKYPCANYLIDILHQNSSTDINITFNGITTPVFCLHAIEPADAIIDLENLSIGTYNLNFSDGETEYKGQLIVSNDSYKVRIDNNPKFCFTNTSTNRTPEMTNILMLKVDYMTSKFEGGYEFTFEKKTDDFSISTVYNSPGDFGDIKLFYSEINEMLFYGTLIWMGRGKILYPDPDEWLSSEHFERDPTDDLVRPKNGYERILNDDEKYFGYYDHDYDAIWDSFQSCAKVRKCLSSNPEQKAKLYFYKPSVGPGDPSSWKWIIFLKK